MLEAGGFPNPVVCYEVHGVLEESAGARDLVLSNTGIQHKCDLPVGN